MEAWEFIVGGGGSFNQLNGIYTVENPAGKTPDNEKILRALTNLKEFMYSFDFLKMSPDKSLVVSGIPSGAHLRSISQPGQQYALYLHHGQGREERLQGGAGKLCGRTLNLPAGTYKSGWVDPARQEVNTEAFAHSGGTTFPRRGHRWMALRIRRNPSHGQREPSCDRCRLLAQAGFCNLSRLCVLQRDFVLVLSTSVPW